MDQYGTLERRRRNIRIGLFFIIVATLPFYCVGILLLGTAPQRVTATLTPNIPISPLPNSTATNTPLPSITPFGTLVSTLPPLQPTPTQFVPLPGFTFVPPTAILPPIQFPTLFIPPTLTPAPTLTPFPSETPFPTELPFPTATWTLLPILTEVPTDFPTPVDPNNPPTENPGQVAIPPTDDPGLIVVQPTETVIPPDGGPRAGG